MKNPIFLLFLLSSFSFISAQQKKIKILNAEQTYKNQAKYPGAIILNGNVKVSHDGAILDCNKALFYKDKNILHAYGNVLVNQGDTIRQTSEYTNYNGNTQKIISWGNVIINDPSMQLETDTLHFDRITQEMTYDCYAKIIDANNQLTSKNGLYSTTEKKFTATTDVVVFNPENKLESNHLDYYTETGEVYFYGPSTITTQESIATANKGFYDSKIGISRLINDAKIYYDNRIIEGDSIYNDKNRGFASSTGNVVMTDTINQTIVKGGYGEFFRDQDSIFVIKKALFISTAEVDSLFIHGDTLLITGQPDKRIIRAYHRVKFFKTDLRGKCDSLHTNQKTGITKMFKHPVIWSGNNQITGDSIYLTSDLKTNKLDSLFIKRNAFIIQKDSAGFSQIKGKNMYGKFVDNQLTSLLTKGNGEVVNYARDEEKKLVAILNMICSNILFNLMDNNIQTIHFLMKPEGKTYPPSKYPNELRFLKGFIWREEEKPLVKEDIFKNEPVITTNLYK
ncbi:OstA-like protein [Flavicella sp.]|uniref:OstA-like protein n=1 Tax=Flavicella sp. TaxID=2957742 RepID=UPI00301679BD